MSLHDLPPGLPPGCQPDFERLLAFPLDTPERMTEALDRYLVSVRAAVERYPNVNVELAEVISGQLRRLLAYPPSTPEIHQRWVQAAARYFFLNDDGSHDWESADGFRDDAQVVSAVDEALELP